MKTAILSTVAALVATTATAGTIVAPNPDPVIAPTPAPAPVTSPWNGFYAGASFGWNTGEEFVPAPPTTFNGLTYGGFAGYNFVMDSGFMVGGELAATRVNREYSTSTVNNAMVFDAKLRAGFAADRALIYASGGYSMVNYDTGGFQGQGWNAGAGVDYLVTDSMFVGAEYIYRDIDDSQNTPPNWETRSHTIQLRAGLKF